MTIKFRLVKGNVFGLPSGPHDCQINGHIALINTGRSYEGLGLKDLKRRLNYWVVRVGLASAYTEGVEGPARKDADKLIKSGERLIKGLAKTIAQRTAA